MIRLIDRDSISDAEVFDDDEIVVVMTRAELKLCAGGFRETLEAIDDWEFETRMGVTRADIRRMSARIRAVLRES